MLELRENEAGLLVKIKVQPKASKNEIKGVQGDALKVRLTSPPVDGAANLACQNFFAELLDIPKSHVKITTGLTSRNKTLLIEGLSRVVFMNIINQYL
ncbi:MAG: hypothetical protein JM58_10315 [Peptococcaceae bacterium BICA1-8]|nr:MAG: hypothetical protein JM58_10315 [Peptococcaceae bacterium BICA1-8]